MGESHGKSPLFARALIIQPCSLEKNKMIWSTAVFLRKFMPGSEENEKENSTFFQAFLPGGNLVAREFVFFSCDGTRGNEYFYSGQKRPACGLWRLSVNLFPVKL